jgi:hypothetical protein
MNIGTDAERQHVCLDGVFNGSDLLTFEVVIREAI